MLAGHARGEVRVRVVEVAVLPDREMVRPMAAMWRNPRTRVSARAITYSRSPAKFAAPALPASQSVVTPVEAQTGSVSTPRS